MRLDQVTGKMIAGDDKYDQIEWRGMKWADMSEVVRKRDGNCLKCGSKENLQADHFHPLCYIFIDWFFRMSKIQTLCAKCHAPLTACLLYTSPSPRD